MCRFFILCLIFFFSTEPVWAQQTTPQWFSVKAFLPAWDGVPVKLIVDGRVVHSGMVQKDMYSYTGSVTEPGPAVLSIKREGRTQFLPFFIEPGTVKIKTDGRRLQALGTPFNNAYNALLQSFDSAALLQKGMAFTEYRNFKRQRTKEYILFNPSSIISLKLLDDFFYKDAAADDTLYYQLFYSLSPLLQQSYLGKKIGAEAAQRNATAVGHTAPLLQLSDTAHKMQPLYKNGLYTLVNFWASWCLPCRVEHPELIRVYNKYKDFGFTITGVSLDQNRAAWLAAIKKEGLEWTQLGDRNAFESKVVKQYGVRVVPTNFLIDPSGIIIGRNINTDMLAEKLHLLFLQKRADEKGTD